MGSSRRLRAVFVGGGWVTRNRHLPAARALLNLELVGLVSKSDHLADLATQFGLRNFSEDLSATWVRDEVDVAFIGTPPHTHHELTMRSLEMGKHVLVEKPFGLRVEEADEMIRAARDRELSLAIVHNFQFARAPMRALARCRSGAIGEIRAVFGFQSSNRKRRLPSWYRELPLGLFTDEAPHLIYLMLAFLKRVTPTAIEVGPKLDERDNTPEWLSAQFRSPEGIPATILMYFTGALSEWHITIFGSKRTLVVDLFRDILIELPDDGGHRSLEVLRTSSRTFGAHFLGFLRSGLWHVSGNLDYGNREVFRRFLAGVVEGCEMRGIEPEDGRAVVELMECINETERQPRRPK